MAHLFFRFADTNGDGTGNISGVGDFSVTPRELLLSPPAGRVYEVYRMIVTVKDTGTFDADSYGNGIVLANGISLTGQSEGEAIDLTGQSPILTNAEWGSYCYDTDNKTWGTGDEFLLVRWTFAKAGDPIVLDSRAGDFLKITLNDNFSGLTAHKFQLQGKSISLNSWPNG